MTGKGIQVLVAASLSSCVLGTVHAYSVLIEPLELRFTASRSQISLTYSLALVFLTFAVLLGPRIFSRWRPERFVLAVCIVAAIGLIIAAFASSLLLLWLGFGLVFGAANGLGYGYGLQIAAQANPKTVGMAMGVVTACYALGATTAPLGFSALLEAGGSQAALLGLATVIVAIAPFSAWLLRRARIRFAKAPDQKDASAVSSKLTLLLWLGYGTAVTAGLMAIGHAAPIAQSMGFRGQAWVPPALIAICNMGGSFVGGTLLDRFGATRLLLSIPIISAFALLIVSTSTGSGLMLLGFGLIGAGYGAIIAAYPATIRYLVGERSSALVYGKVFTAWGAAGLFGPWLAATVFDRSGGYEAALWVAAAISLISTLAAAMMFRRAAPPSG